MIIGCCDSRVAPEAIFDAGPGELFVIRNVGNLVPPYAPDNQYHGTSAALEYAVMALKVQHVVVLGHAQCGGVRLLRRSPADPDAPRLGHATLSADWIKLLGPAAERAGAMPNPITADYVERLAFEVGEAGSAQSAQLSHDPGARAAPSSAAARRLASASWTAACSRSIN